MSNKNQSSLKRKQAKAAKRQKHLRQAAHASEQKVFERKRQSAAQREEDMARRIAIDGVVKTADALRKEGYDGKTAKKLNNIEVLKGINLAIPICATLHGSVEVVEQLVGEKRFELTEEQTSLIAEFDRDIVGLVEDINAIYDFIEAGKVPNDYMELYVHYVEILAEIQQFKIPAVLDTLLRPNKDAIDLYIKEHAEHSTLEAYSMEMHNFRMERVAPLYSTHSEIAADMTMPIDGPGGTLLEEDEDPCSDFAKDVSPNPLSC